MINNIEKCEIGNSEVKHDLSSQNYFSENQF